MPEERKERVIFDSHLCDVPWKITANADDNQYTRIKVHGGNEYFYYDTDVVKLIRLLQLALSDG